MNERAKTAQDDYYEIMQLFPGASADQIRKSYRKLAQVYHPDKNPADASATENFRKLLEAYTILSDSELRYEYDRESGYLQKNSTPPSAQSLAKESERLKNYVYGLDMFRMDKEALRFHIFRLLSPGYIRILTNSEDLINKRIYTESLLAAGKFIPFNQFAEAFPLLEKVAGDDEYLIKIISACKKNIQQEFFWKKFTPLLVILLTLLLCLFIFLLSDL